VRVYRYYLAAKTEFAQRPLLAWSVRALFTAVALAMVVQLLRNADYSFASSFASIPSFGYGLMGLALALLPLNYGTEALKWQSVMPKPGTHLGFAHAIQAVLVGHAFGAITPGRLGEYLGRTLVLPAESRRDAVAATFLSRFAQLLPTAGIGLIVGWWWLAGGIGLPGWVAAIGALLVAGLQILLAERPRTFYRSITHILGLVLPVRWFWRRVAHVQELQLRRLIRLAYLRYAVFCTQYLLLISAFGGLTNGLADVPVAFALISLTYLVKSCVPSFTLAEFGIRESVAISLAGALGLPIAAVFNATAALFVLNLLAPALLGGTLWALYSLLPTRTSAKS